MAKSRVEKNKALYDELELEPFELEDITSGTKNDEIIVEEPKIEKPKVEKTTKASKKQELVPVIKHEKKHEVALVKEEKKVAIEEDEFVVEQPISYTDKLSVEEILRAKLEKQQKLKNDKKVYKKSPVTESYTPEMMQKNINQKEGIDIRKEANIKVKNNNDLIVGLLVFLLIIVIVLGVIAAYLIW